MGEKVPAGLGAVVSMRLSELSADPKNPRKIPVRAVEMVAKSIREFGWQQPIVVDKDLVVIVGHTRLLAAKSLGLVDVPVVVADKLSARQVKAYRIDDNRTGDFSSWDFPELASQLDDLAEDFGDLFGLADWAAISTQFDVASQAAVSVSDTAMSLAPEVGNYLSNDFLLTVVCTSKEAARKVALAIIEMEGVSDVRDKR